MLPLRADLPGRVFPLVTLLIIVANALVFLYQSCLILGAAAVEPQAPADFVREFGLTPCRLTGTCVALAGVPHPVATMFSSMFLHGGLLHVAGNMLYLWIFGNSLESALGHGRFLAFYLLSGLLAALAQTAFQPDASLPMIGASGAVAGVLGGYSVLFPRATISTLLILGYFIRLVRVPAIVVLGAWFAAQLLSGMLATQTGAVPGDVAWCAHLGGFAAGVALLFLVRARTWARL